MAELILNKDNTNLLENFAAINTDFSAVEGDTQRIASTTREVMAIANFTMPKTCDIRDLNKILGLVKVHATKDDVPTLAFDDTMVRVVHSLGETTLPYAVSGTVIKPSTATFSVDEPYLTFTLKQSVWEMMKRTMSLIRATHLQVSLTKSGPKMRLIDPKDTTSSSGRSTFSCDDAVVNDAEKMGKKKLMTKLASLQLLDGDYNVTIGGLFVNGKATGHGMILSHQNGTIVYVVALADDKG